MNINGGRDYQEKLDSLKVTAQQFLGENENFTEEKLKKIETFSRLPIAISTVIFNEFSYPGRCIIYLKIKHCTAVRF